MISSTHTYWLLFVVVINTGVSNNTSLFVLKSFITVHVSVVFCGTLKLLLLFGKSFSIHKRFIISFSLVERKKLAAIVRDS